MVAVIVKVAGLVALVAVLLHSYYGDRVAFLPSSSQKGTIDGPFGREAALLGALQKALRTRHPLPLFIGLGYNTNLDLVVDALEVVQALGVQPPQGPTEHPVISSATDLQETFGHYFKQGSAAERYVADVPLFERLDAQASAVYSTGGNAALMANRLAELGSEVFLGGPIGPRLAELLHPNIQHMGGEGTKDEVHLILEYPRGAQWGHLTAPRANRFIAVHDETNSQLLALEEFHAAMEPFEPDLIILAGLHLLEGQPDQVRRERVGAVRRAVEETDPEVDVHFELASISDEDLLLLVTTQLISHVDSLGLNEQELGALVQALGKMDSCNSECKVRVAELELSAFTSPTVHTVTDALKLVFQVLDHKDPQQRLLTRIHFHYLSFHVVAERRTTPTASARWRRWGSGAMSVVGGSLGATARACGDGRWDVSTADVEVRLQRETLPQAHHDERRTDVHIDPVEPVTMWEEGDAVYYLAPVLVCKRPTRTGWCTPFR
ncbi:ADPdependent glucokinase [Acanthamoeba castellanii str. Neff]|uniref:ADPdependent glucokinase n=1 Tax=Acanthamoeba castellanii (strain ATCC 30010 / Neff) TaxID=1257118 RepID=L8GIZ6_ACACF|nr:ADPdependent glucokinase [Acanthamoeba castellanii str. Neff]ELR12829.1 ADPdependent glucokinase [Acanthamoeba castellanii str. Neff]